MMGEVVKVVAVKTPTDLLDQFDRGLQVDMSGMDIYVAHIG
jgi:hypothetical protein